MRVLMVTAQSSIDDATNRISSLDKVITDKKKELDSLENEFYETQKLFDDVFSHREGFSQFS